ncbi:GNAT family N-acetyltransferase [Bacillus sp. ISL-35]|uniref:GNAT family N-acetyltransferase n=1 Tax=Bacillus sp. ISL-35 TaxID=2819122 RepID=UPI001BEA3774|nr:GNAT family N-acetyltransferase [Bacillus sp. ISL-35]MBT2680991.1 GNAT family N-acetyltransferase [Bacillus sp. ISL-35]MBT2705310.1 GNAT family N-acetyltransferase [Chryseobacterium sp. ISL-80]
MEIRQAEERDADKFARLIQEVENSSDFMLFGPGERKFNPEAQKKMIHVLKSEPNSNIFLAETAGQLTGYLIAKGGSAPRTKHSAYLVIGIKDLYRGKGVGTSLFTELLDWASGIGLRRLELTVVTENQGAVSLYTKMGFQIEGTKKDSMFKDGQFYDEYYMSRIL